MTDEINITPEMIEAVTLIFNNREEFNLLGPDDCRRLAEDVLRAGEAARLFRAVMDSYTPEAIAENGELCAGGFAICERKNALLIECDRLREENAWLRVQVELRRPSSPKMG